MADNHPNTFAAVLAEFTQALYSGPDEIETFKARTFAPSEFTDVPSSFQNTLPTDGTTMYTYLFNLRSNDVFDLCFRFKNEEIGIAHVTNNTFLPREVTHNRYFATNFARQTFQAINADMLRLAELMMACLFNNYKESRYLVKWAIQSFDGKAVDFIMPRLGYSLSRDVVDDYMCDLYPPTEEDETPEYMEKVKTMEQCLNKYF
jgi:hypothetical protein